MFKVILLSLFGMMLHASINGNVNQVELQMKLQESIKNGVISTSALDQYCGDVTTLDINTDDFLHTREICSERMYADTTAEVALRNMISVMGLELAQFDPKRVGLTRSTSSTASQIDYVDMLPPPGTASVTLSKMAGTHTQGANVSLWSVQNEAFIRFEPTGQHFNVSSYDFTFMQDGIQASSPSFVRKGQGFTGNIYSPTTFKMVGGPCSALEFTAEFSQQSLTYAPTSPDASACQSGGTTCTDILPPQDVTPSTVNYSGKSAELYAWSDGTTSYVRVKPTDTDFYFYSYYYKAMQYGVQSNAYFYYCDNSFWSGTLTEAKTFIVKENYNAGLFSFNPAKNWSLYYQDYSNYSDPYTLIATLNPSADSLPTPDQGQEIYINKPVPQNAVQTTINTGDSAEATVSLWSEGNVAYLNVTPKNVLASFNPHEISIDQFNRRNDIYYYLASQTGNINPELFSSSVTMKLDNAWACVTFDPSVAFTLESGYPEFSLPYAPTTASGNSIVFGEGHVGDKMPPQGVTPVDFVSSYSNGITQLYLWSEANVPYLRVVPESGKTFYWSQYNLEHIQHNLKNNQNFWGRVCDYRGSTSMNFQTATTIRFEPRGESNWYSPDPAFDPSHPFVIQGDGSEFSKETVIAYTPSDPSTTVPLQARQPAKDAQTLTYGPQTFTYWNDPQDGLLVRLETSDPSNTDFVPVDLVQNDRTLTARYTTRGDDKGGVSLSNKRGPVTLRVFSTSYDDYPLNTKKSIRVYNYGVDNVVYPFIDIDGKTGGSLPALFFILFN